LSPRRPPTYTPSPYTTLFRSNDGPVVGRAEHGRTSHEGVRTGRMDDTDVVDFHAAVDFQTDGLAAGLDPGVDATAGFPQFLQRRRDELLAAETGVDRHEQDDVQLVHDVVHPVQGSGRVEHQPCTAAVVPDQTERAVGVAGSLGVEGDEVGTGL